MKVIAFPRKEQGSGASRRLRNAGQTPGIIYGGAAAPSQSHWTTMLCFTL